jgi:hypothetical protein
LSVEIFVGSIADHDTRWDLPAGNRFFYVKYRLFYKQRRHLNGRFQGLDAVTAIELVEHLEPDALAKFPEVALHLDFPST